MECSDPNMEYKSAIVGCPETCEGVAVCVGTPVEGCVCRRGYVLSDRACVKKEECGCLYTQNIDNQLVSTYVEVSLQSL